MIRSEGQKFECEYFAAVSCSRSAKHASGSRALNQDNNQVVLYYLSALKCPKPKPRRYGNVCGKRMHQTNYSKDLSQITASISTVENLCKQTKVKLASLLYQRSDSVIMEVSWNTNGVLD